MTITGNQLIGGSDTPGKEATFFAVNPATGEQLSQPFTGAGKTEVELACALAAEAFSTYRHTSLSERASFLEQIAQNILVIGDELIDAAMSESGLPRTQLEGERTRTVNQLNLFAAMVRSGDWLGMRHDPALPDRQPLPRPDIRLRHIGIGPVAVFGASNFPLAFSVAGGDTASALAAGCPVILKGHPAHPATSELVGRAVQKAVFDCGLHVGVFALLVGPSIELGAALVADPRIKAVGFTGSRGGGMALMRIAASRPEPIPVFAEMSSLNPVVLLPGALATRAESIAKSFAVSLTKGAGQFCTNPGLLLAIEGPGYDAFLHAATEAIEAAPAGTMLTPAIHGVYTQQTANLAKHGALRQVVRGQPGTGPHECQAALMVVDSSDFLLDPVWHNEVFGASSVLVRCPDLATLQDVIGHLEGQLTATLQMDPADLPMAQQLVPKLEEKVGRILVNGWPTGVEVASAMVHGGPFPATSDARMTSVGTLAITRFLRPVCYQDFPEALLPEVFKH
ncbi:aldehyde dehydrogenase family protein [Massilia dura]|uniref:Aldehyde dehydrogenase family protein n=1 Tax=Pseudoduganella dura TaxID=321982 RepID=A0A6I3XSD7_9BURK|nr:aldehyde dehydrogenase (NADP(+)) [Pseudoduganella dura]MUI15378.1 aldehyde dehydrogenase family protein [Pseudoduganella dura]GGX80388.1 2,5-dioxovalerate dehydrogenase [Pseudoduganella dura]